MKHQKENQLKAVKGNSIENNKYENVSQMTKLPLAMCRQILNSGERKYTDEEVIKIRDYLYRLAAIAAEQAEINAQEAKLISITEDKNQRDEQSNYLRTG